MDRAFGLDITGFQNRQRHCIGYDMNTIPRRSTCTALGLVDTYMPNDTTIDLPVRHVPKPVSGGHVSDATGTGDHWHMTAD